MISQEFREELDNYILLHYRPEGAKIKNFNDDKKLPAPAGMALGAIASLISSELYKRVARLGATFSEKLMWWIKKQGRKPVEVYSSIDISKEHFAKIRNNPPVSSYQGNGIGFCDSSALKHG